MKWYHGSQVLNIQDKLAEIEQQVYPEFMQSLHTDIEEYCEAPLSNIHVLMGASFYVIVTEHKKHYEFVDIATTQTLNIFKVFKEVLNFFTNTSKYVVLDARVSTSYKLVELACSRYGWYILRKSTWNWEGEEMVEMVIKKGVK